MSKAKRFAGDFVHFQASRFRSRISTFGLIATAMAAAGGFEPLHAQEQDAAKENDDVLISTIVVTARRQSESLMEVPVAASVLDTQILTTRSISDMTGLAGLVPQVSIEPTLGAAGAAFTIRGIGSSGTDAGAEQTVAVNLDGVQVSRGQIIRQSLFDLEQVEVLRGPQALFFGKNSPGGVISVTSRGPTSDFEASLRAGYEFNAREKILEGALSGPLTDTIGARLAVRGVSMDGWMRNVAEPINNPFITFAESTAVLPGASYDRNGLKEVLGRFTLEYSPSSDFTATLRLFGSANEYSGDHANAEITNCAIPPLPQTLGVPDPFGDCQLDNVQSNGALPEAEARTVRLFRDGQSYGRYTSYSGSLTLEYSTGPVSLTSVTGLVHYRQQVGEGSLNTVYSNANFNASVDEFDQLSQELRLITDFDAPINLTLGAYYEHNSVDTEGALIIAPHGPDPRNGSIASSEKLTTSRGDAYSVFGQARWDIFDELELAGGVRYTHEAKRGTALNTFVNTAFPFGFIYAPEGLLFQGRTSANNFSPEVTLAWHPSRSTTLYAAYRTGFKSGGFGAPTLITANIISGSQLVYEPETALGGEVGFKTMLFDDQLRLTGTVYRYDYTNLQLSNFNAASFTQTINNVGGARTQGVELEALWQPTRALTIRGGVGYTHARYTSFPGIACYSGQTAQTGCDPMTGAQDLTGQPLVRAPDWSANAGFNYETSLSEELMIGFNADARYSSGYFTQENNSPFAYQNEYVQIDASARLFTPDDQWTLALIGRNLTDESYAISSFDNPNSPAGEVGSGVSRSRQILLEIRFSY